jgi:hypothetical protein
MMSQVVTFAGKTPRRNHWAQSLSQGMRAGTSIFLVLEKTAKNPLCRFLVKYQADNVEKCFYQYFTICGRGTNENALLRVLKVISTYGQDSELDKVLNLFQFVYDQIRMHSSGNRVKNGAKKRKQLKRALKFLLPRNPKQSPL